jgi:hypothetical protein
VQVSLQQIKNINNLGLPQLSAAFVDMQTTRDLPSISALKQAVPASVAAYYASSYATGSGPNGTLVLTDLLGAAVGVDYTSVLSNVTVTINSMTSTGILAGLTNTYGRMQNTVNGVYGDAVAGPVTIPAGTGAGVYANADAALKQLIANATIQVSAISVSYPAQSGVLNSDFNSMAAKLVSENTNLALASIDIPNLVTSGRGPIMSFVQNLPGYGTNTEVNGPAQFIETVADLATQGGQAMVACLREGRNLLVLNGVGIGQDTAIPSEYAGVIPQANLIPSTYSDAEAANLVVK